MRVATTVMPQQRTRPTMSICPRNKCLLEGFVDMDLEMRYTSKMNRTTTSAPAATSTGITQISPLKNSRRAGCPPRFAFLVLF